MKKTTSSQTKKAKKDQTQKKSKSESLQKNQPKEPSAKNPTFTNLQPIFPAPLEPTSFEDPHTQQNLSMPPVEQNPSSSGAESLEKPFERTFNEQNPYYHIINQVIDPEAGIGIADMGLIYEVKEQDGVVDVTMTLTSMGCPAGPQLTTDVDGILRMQEGVKDVLIQVVWNPPWNPDMMNPEIRAMLFGGFYG